MPRLPFRSRRRDRGVALVLTLAILALLAFVSVAFAILTRVEVRAVQNYRDGERARYASWSGIERAKFELRRAVTTKGYPVPWLEYDVYDYSSSSFQHSASSGTGSAFQYEYNYFTSSYNDAFVNGQISGSFVAGADIPTHFQPSDIEHTVAPSYGVHLETKPDVLVHSTTEGKQLNLPWPSGVLGGTYYTDRQNRAFKGDYYTLRVTDCNSQIYLNDGNPSLASMLQTLAEEVTGKTGAFGSTVVSKRPPVGGFRRADELLGLPELRTAGFTEDDLRKVLPFVTTTAYVDYKVIAGRKGTSGGDGRDLTLQPRAPININLAPYPVLLAALRGVGVAGGTHVSKSTAGTVAKAIMKYRKNLDLALAAGGTTTYPRIVPAGGSDEVRSRRYGFASWGEFYQFLKEKCSLSDDERFAILANANPNTDLNKFVPDLSMFRPIDKTDLGRPAASSTSAAGDSVGSTTEFCFSSGGVFQVESLGVILGPDAVPVAQARTRALVRVFDRYIETTQTDLEGDRIDKPGNGTVEGLGTLAGLRDMVTLPESRNVNDALLVANNKADEDAFNIFTAPYDGQITFNVITRTKVAENGTYVAFLDRTLNGRGTIRAGRQNDVITPDAGGSNARVIPAGSGTSSRGPGKVVDDISNPDFDTGTDLHCLGALLGRSRVPRELRYEQLYDDGGVLDPVVTYVPSKDGSPPITVTLHFNETVTSGGTLIARLEHTLTGSIDPYKYESTNRQAFEFWIKPGRENREETLLNWESGESHEVQSKSKDALAQGTSVVTSSSFVGGFTTNFQTDHRHSVYVGGQAKLRIWLTPDGTPTDDTFGYKLNAKFEFKGTAPSLGGVADQDMTPSQYVRTWTLQQKLFAGTWHHVLFGIKVPETLGEAASGRKTWLYLDGNDQDPGSETAWPTERESIDRLIQITINDMVDEFRPIIAALIANANQQGFGRAVTEGSSVLNTPPPYPINRVPSSIIATDGDKIFVGIGKDNANPYNGIIDNIIFHNKFAAQVAASDIPAGESFLPRYDVFRPSKGTGELGAPTTDDDLAFRKRIRALEWDRSVRVVAYNFTAWQQSPSAADKEPVADLGKVFGNIGYANVPSGQDLEGQERDDGTLPTLPREGQPAVFGADKGWTAALSMAAGYNTLAAGFVIPPPDTGQAGGAAHAIFANGRADGYKTRAVPQTGGTTSATAEYTNYALQVLKTTTPPVDGPRMAPVIDDVTITFMPWDVVNVIEEEEIVD